jgi:hypothetical protein
MLLKYPAKGLKKRSEHVERSVCDKLVDVRSRTVVHGPT